MDSGRVKSVMNIEINGKLHVISPEEELLLFAEESTKTSEVYLLRYVAYARNSKISFMISLDELDNSIYSHRESFCNRPVPSVYL